MRVRAVGTTKENLVIAISMALFVLLLSLVLAAGGLGYILPPPQVRLIASWYLRVTFNPFERLFSAMAPEGVTSIVWDFRGLDTLFETTVFYLAIIGSIAIARGVIGGHKEVDEKKLGLSLIVKSVTRISLGMILAVAASIALHGHLTPGGGFQGGASAAVAPLILLVVFSRYFIEKHGITKNTMLILRSIGLFGIGMTAFIVVIIALASGAPAFVFQNQPKTIAPTGMPFEIGGALTGGTLWFFNVFEMVAVAAGFTIIFLLLAIPEEEYKKILRLGGGEHE